MTNNSGMKFNLSEWALNQRSLVIFMMLVIMLAGVLSYQNLSRNEDPPFTIKTLVVSAYWPGASTEDTANLLTDKIEQKLQEMPYLDRIDSYSRNGEAVVFLNLRDDTPPAKVSDLWYQARKKISDIAPSLPRGVQGPFFDDEFGDTYAIIYGLVPEGFTFREARDKLDDLRNELLKTKDIGKVILLGVQEEQILIEFSPAKLSAYGLDVKEALNIFESQNAVSPSGVIRLPDELIAVRVSGAYQSEKAIENVSLRINDRFVKLIDIASVKRVSASPPTPLYRVNGKPALGIAVSMADGGNLLEFGEAVRKKVETFDTKLPHGLELQKVADQTQVVKSAVKDFIKVLIEAIVIVLAVSFISLGTRAGLVVTLSIPLVLALTFIGMDLTGIGLQRISLGALIIALGLLVDDAMITVEAMVSRLELGWKLDKAATFAYESTAFPMLTGTLVMIAGFIPVGFAASSAGEYCFSLFMVILISLMASWIVAVLFSPLIGTWILSSKVKPHGDGGRVMGAYKKALAKIITTPRRVIAVSFVAFILSVGASTLLEEQFFPPSDRPELLVNLQLPQNATIEATMERTKQLEAMLKDNPLVDHFSSYVGAGAIRFYLPMDVLLSNENISQTVIVTKGLEERNELRSQLDKAFTQSMDDITTRIMPLELGPPVGWPLKYRVTGPDIAKVRDYAMQLANIVSENPNTRDVNLTSGEPQKMVRVEVNQIEAAALGLTSEQIASTLAMTFSGAPVTSVRDGRRLIEVLVRASDIDRGNIDTIANLQITTPSGRAIPLRQVADVKYGVQEPIIWKRQREPIITVQADIGQGLQPATVSKELSEKVSAFAAKLPQGYSVAEGGAVEEAQKGSQSILNVIPLMLLVMVSLLMVQLRSLSRTAIAVLMAPFGLIGIVLAMLPTGTPLGFVAQLGVIALAGMVIRNAVILIEEVDANIRQGESINDAITHASIHRARPIMLTACAAILGMIPIAHQVFWGPMAYAIIGGLAVATILTLTLLPCVLVLLLEWEARQERKINHEAA